LESIVEGAVGAAVLGVVHGLPEVILASRILGLAGLLRVEEPLYPRL
jgi:hypothetical protein